MRAYLLNLSVQHDAVFSQLAVPIAVVLWLYITAFAVLLGADFNAEIELSGPTRNILGGCAGSVVARNPPTPITPKPLLRSAGTERIACQPLARCPCVDGFDCQ